MLCRLEMIDVVYEIIQCPRVTQHSTSEAGAGQTVSVDCIDKVCLLFMDFDKHSAVLIADQL